MNQTKNLDPLITVTAGELLKTAAKLKEDGFGLLLFLCGIDYPDRIELVYRLYSLNKPASAMHVKTQVSKDSPTIDSVVSLWPAANWHEREVFDLFGVTFKGHPNLKRLFMPDDWIGHPLRKDYTDDRMLLRPPEA